MYWWWWMKKTIEMWWLWWWRREGGGVNLYKCPTFYLFLGLHSAPPWEGDVSWFCSVCEKSLSRKDIMQRHVMSKQSKACLTPFQQLQCLQKNVSGFTSSILSHAWLPGWPGLERRRGFDLYYSKLQRQFTFPWRGQFGVIHNGNLRIQKR